MLRRRRRRTRAGAGGGRANGAARSQFKHTINEEYHHNWIIDNLPAASVIDNDQYITTSYSRGFPIG